MRWWQRRYFTFWPNLENNHLEHPNFSSYIYYTYTHVTWSKKYIYFLKTIKIYKRNNQNITISYGAKATVKSGIIQFHWN